MFDEELADAIPLLMSGTDGDRERARQLKKERWEDMLKKAASIIPNIDGRAMQGYHSGWQRKYQ